MTEAANLILAGFVALAVWFGLIALTFAPSGVILLIDQWKERHS